MSTNFENLVAQAKENEDAEDAAVNLLGVLSEKLAVLVTQLADSPTKQQLMDLAAGMKTHSQALGSAIVENTPADSGA